MACIFPNLIDSLVCVTCFVSEFELPVLLFFFFFFFLIFRDRVSLCSPGCPGTHSVDQAGLELRNPPASASQVLGLKAWATTPRLKNYFMCMGVLPACMSLAAYKGQKRASDPLGLE